MAPARAGRSELRPRAPAAKPRPATTLLGAEPAVSSPMPDDEPRIREVAADVEETRERLGEAAHAVPDPDEASSPQEWTAYAHAKLGAAREELRRAAGAGEGDVREALEAGRSELVELSEQLPEGRAVSPAEREAHRDPALSTRVAEMVADLDAAIDRRDEA